MTHRTTIDGIEELDVRLYWARVEALPPQQVDQIRQIMSPEERRREERFRHDPSRRCHLVTRRLVRRTLSRLGSRSPEQWRFGQDDSGRPFLANPTDELEDVDFNIAQSRHRVVLAICRGGRVGIDLEPGCRRVDHDLVAEKYFHPRECRDLERLDGLARRRRFLQLWVLKEAWMKADGRGMGAGLNRVVFGFDSSGSPRLEEVPDGDITRWKVVLRRAGDHLVAVARTSALCDTPRTNSPTT